MTTMTTENTKHAAALAAFLGCDIEDITPQSWDNYGMPLFETPEGEYAVGTDSQADAACREYIEQSLWAFNPDFIIENCGLPRELGELLKSYAIEKCEGANDALLALVNKCGDFDRLVRMAISLDGRGHFLSSYDGEENEQTVDGVAFYIFKS
jgi:hypothetical protein